MVKTDFGVALMVSFVISVGFCDTSLRNVNEIYLQDQVLLKNVVKSVRHVVEIRPVTNMPYYCAFIFSPPGEKPLEMINMLRSTQKTLVIINTWPDSKGNYNVPNRRNCSSCENIIIFASMTDVYKIISSMNVNCTAARIELLVATYEISDSNDEARRSSKLVIDLAWKQLRAHATVLVPVDNRVLAIKSKRHIPYVRCEPEPPEIMAYLENDTFVGNLSFEHFEYNKCVVQIATTNCWHLVHLAEVNGQEIMTGLEGQILETIAEKQNYTMKVMNAIPPGNAVPSDVIENSTWVRRKLQSGEADIGACSMWVRQLENIKFTTSYCAHTVVLMIPIPKYIPFASILHTFSKSVWICVVIGSIVGRVLIRMNRRSISSLMALALFLGVSVASTSRGFVEKSQMTLWVIYGYLITQSYIASLASVLNDPWVHKIETVEELAASDIRVTGYPIESGRFQIDEKYKRIIDTFINISEPEHSQMMENPDKFLLDAQQTGILVDILLINNHGWRSKYYQLKEGITNFPLGMAMMSRTRVSLDEIDRTIAFLIESGLMSKWSDENMILPGSQRIHSDIEVRSPTLSLDEVAGIFVILAAGLLLSMIVFIFEVYKKQTSKNNTRLKFPKLGLIGPTKK